MKSMIIIALALVAVAAAIPVDEPAKIVRQYYERQPDGSYKFEFETEDGVKRNEVGELREALNEENILQKFIAISGASSYINSNGQIETISYVADENGYRAEGPSIPKVPASS